MTDFWNVLLFSSLGGVVSLTGGALLLKSKKSADTLAQYATPFAAGALLAAVFLDLLPEADHEGQGAAALTWALIGIIVFFFMERFLHWFHHHHDHGSKTENGHQKTLIIIGDTLHNALDGVVIAASFLISVPTGIVTTIAVAAHEIPQEIGDFGLLLSRGMSRRNVLVVNLLSALSTVAAAVLTYYLGSQDALPIGPLLGLSAGFLLYIASSDIIPTIHEQAAQKRKLLTAAPLLLLAGVIIVAASINIAHRYIDVHDIESSTGMHQDSELCKELTEQIGIGDSIDCDDHVGDHHH